MNVPNPHAGAVTNSRVADARKPITSRSGANRAIKARETLATAQAILEASGHSTAAWQLRAPLREITEQLHAYYVAERAKMAAQR